MKTKFTISVGIFSLLLISSCSKTINYEEEKENVEIKTETVYFKNNQFDGILNGVDFVMVVDKGYKSKLTKFYESGNIKDDFIYNSKGQLHGEQLQYYENGQLKVKYKYQDGKLYGEQFSYYENGQIKRNVNYINFGTVSKKKSMSESKLDNYYYEYFEDGKIKIKGFFDYGYRIGEHLLYHRNGQIKMKTNYPEQTEIHKIQFLGEQFEYFENGKIKKKGNYVDVWLRGDQIEYYENGQIKRKVKCNRYPSNIVDYFENGNIKSDITLGYGYSTTIFGQDFLDFQREFVRNEHEHWDFYNPNHNKEWFIENNER